MMPGEKNPPANAGAAGDAGFNPWVWKDPLKEEMATSFSILAETILWTEEPGVAEVRHD